MAVGWLRGFWDKQIVSLIVYKYPGTLLVDGDDVTKQGQFRCG